MSTPQGRKEGPGGLDASRSFFGLLNVLELAQGTSGLGQDGLLLSAHLIGILAAAAAAAAA